MVELLSSYENKNVVRSISHAARDFKLLRHLAVVPGLTASVIALMVLVFKLLSITDPSPKVSWFGTALWVGTAVAIVLGWCATRVRRGSTLTIGTGAVTFSIGMLLLVVWRSRIGEPAIEVVLSAFVPTILAASSWWALRIARRLHSRFPDFLSQPHATRRLSLPHDARALRAVRPALLGGLQVLSAVVVALGLAPLLRQGALSVGYKLYIPGALRNFRRVRAVLALRAQEVRLGDRRPPVLLLRSFADDDLSVKRTKGFLIGVTQRMLSLEEQVISQLWEVGPVVAIGKPGLEIDPIGAAREHIVGPLWQPRVQELMEESALVVVVLGQTEGLFWEYEQLSQRRMSVLAIWPPGEATVLAERWQRFTAAYPRARSIVFEDRSELPLLVWFRKDHEPLIVSGEPRDERSYELAFALCRQIGLKSQRVKRRGGTEGSTVH